MDYQNTLLKNYNARTELLDPSEKEKSEWFDHYVEKVYTKYLALIPKTGSILELGCNKGFLLRSLHALGFSDLYGVDLSEDDLKRAQIIVPSAHLYYQDVFDFLEKHQNQFDFIILKALIEHIKKDKVMLLLEKINNSLKSQGAVLIDVQNSDWFFGLHDRYMDFTHEVGFTKESLQQVMQIHFDDVLVNPTASPYWKMNKRAIFRHKIAKRILGSLLHWAEPEMPNITQRLLLAIGKKKVIKC